MISNSDIYSGRADSVGPWVRFIHLQEGYEWQWAFDGVFGGDDQVENGGFHGYRDCNRGGSQFVKWGYLCAVCWKRCAASCCWCGMNSVEIDFFIFVVQWWTGCVWY